MTAEPDHEEERDREVWAVCGQLKHLSTGERAALRRMFLTKSCEADGLVEKLLRRAGVFLDPLDDASFDMWRVLAHAAAVISGTGAQMAHAGRRPLGRSLSMIGVKSATVNRLLTARGPALGDQVRRLAYKLADGGEAIPTNLTELRNLSHPDLRLADQARRSIARAYFAAEDKKSREKSK